MNDSLTPGAVAVLGIPWDVNSSFLRGAADGPARIREVLHGGATNLCAESEVDLRAEERFIDLGDVDVEGASDTVVQRIESTVAAVVERGALPLSLGGDHAVTYPIVRGLGCTDLTILHLDAHPDLYDEFEGNRLSHACPFARILEQGLCRRLVQVGIRTMNAHQREQAERFGVEVFSMREFRPRLVESLGLESPLYLSIDLDAIDPAHVPGVSHHEPGGLTVREVVDLIADIDAPLLGADIVEFNPRRDHEDMTAMVACKLLKEVAAKLLER